MRQWYIAKTTYCRELTLKRFFESKKKECYVPMKYTEKLSYHGKKRRQLTPAIHNIVFLKSDESFLKEALQDSPVPLYYQKELGSTKWAVVPEKQMQDFLSVANHKKEETEIVDLTEISLTRGDKVRVVQGSFAGIEGEYVKIGGQRRVMVVLYGMVAATTAYIPFDFIEKL